jgi:MscS family membrane protein
MKDLQQLLESISSNPWMRAGILVVASFLAAVLIDWIVNLVMRVLARRTTTTVDDRFLVIIRRPVQITVFLGGMWLATRQLGLASDLEGVISGLFGTICVVVWTVFAKRFSKLLLRVLSKDTERFQVIEPKTLPLFENLGTVLIVGLCLYLLIQVWGQDVSAFIASAGIAGIAIGFAAKDTLSNLFAGVFILADAPYRTGDFIVLDSGERGEVVHIGIRSTRLLTRDDIEVTIPNAVMGAAKIMNETGGRHPKRRLRIKVGVAYGSDIDSVREVLLRVAAEENMICRDPEARVRFRRFGDSALDFELLCWISEPVLRGRVTDRLLSGVYKAFAAEKIEIAFPQLDVHLHQV